MRSLLPLLALTSITACNAILGDDPKSLEASAGASGTSSAEGGASTSTGGSTGHAGGNSGASGISNGGAAGASEGGQTGGGHGGTSNGGSAGHGGLGGHAGAAGATATGGMSHGGSAGNAGSTAQGGVSGNGGAAATGGASGSEAAGGNAGTSGVGGDQTGGTAGSIAGSSATGGGGASAGTNAAGGASGTAGTSSVAGTSGTAGTTSVGGNAGKGGATGCNHNDVLDPGEECDGTDLGDASCNSLVSQGSGKLFCTTSCTFDTSQCAVCGDGVINGDETCDSGSVNLVPTCSTAVFSGDTGMLKCNRCQLDTTNCQHTVMCGSTTFDPLAAHDWPMEGACATHPSRTVVDGPMFGGTATKWPGTQAFRPILVNLGGMSTVVTEAGNQLVALSQTLATKWVDSLGTGSSSIGICAVGSNVFAPADANFNSYDLTTGDTVGTGVAQQPTWTGGVTILGAAVGGSMFANASTELIRLPMNTTPNGTAGQNVQVPNAITTPVVSPDGKTIYLLTAEGTVRSYANTAAFQPGTTVRLPQDFDKFSNLTVAADGSIYLVAAQLTSMSPTLFGIHGDHIYMSIALPNAAAPTDPALMTDGEIVVANGTELVSYYWDGGLAWKVDLGSPSHAVAIGATRVYVGTDVGIRSYAGMGTSTGMVAVPAAVSRIVVGKGYLAVVTAAGDLYVVKLGGWRGPVGAVHAVHAARRRMIDKPVIKIR